jgi:hypothetical protein
LGDVWELEDLFGVEAPLPASPAARKNTSSWFSWFGGGSSAPAPSAAASPALPAPAAAPDLPPLSESQQAYEAQAREAVARCKIPAVVLQGSRALPPESLV